MNIFTGPRGQLRRNLAAIAAVIALFLALRPDQAEAIPAFPGAEGGGANSVGGRGGRVIMVTNTNDSGTGSLRACIDDSGPRTCIFRVGGTISINSGFTPRNSKLTIAGQTAPGGGIQIRATNTSDALMKIFASDVIIRYLRARHGKNGCSNECGGNIYFQGGSARNVLDHVSVQWGMDEGVGTSGAATRPGQKDVTVSWSLIGEGLGSGGEPNRFTGIYFGSGPSEVSAEMTDMDFHHNLTMSTSHRNPLLRNKSIRMVNNLWYNLNRGTTHISGGIVIDIIGSHWKRGPNGPPTSLNPIAAGANLASLSAPGNPSIFLSGNTSYRQADPGGDQYVMAGTLSSENNQSGGAVPSSWRRTAPMAKTPPGVPSITVLPVGALEGSLLPLIGASRQLNCDGSWRMERDAQDTKLINQYNTGGGWASSTPPSNEGGYGGYPTIAPGVACADADLDGMPDAYEVIKGFPVNTASNNVDTDSDGFTNLEEFLAGEGDAVPPDDPPVADKFKDGDRVFVNASAANVRATAGGTLLGTQPLNAEGIVTDGPTVSPNGLLWYNINFDTGTDGWVGESVLSLVVVGSDITPPTVAVTGPQAGATVSGVAVVAATATDNTGVVGVQFKLDGGNLGSEDTSSPYSVTWATTAVADGPHTVTAIARDAAGNVATSAGVAVTVANVAGELAAPTGLTVVREAP